MSFRNIKIFAAAFALTFGHAHATLIDRGGGLIYDDVLNVTWLQNANYGAGSAFDDGASASDGKMTSINALAWATSLTYFDSVRGVTYDDWRLPRLTLVGGGFTFSEDGSTDYSINSIGTNTELGFMFYQNLGNIAMRSPDGHDTGCGASGTPCLQNVGPFVDLMPWTYWSGTSVDETSDPSDRWIFEMYTGLQAPFFEERDVHAWAVRDGDVTTAVVPEPYSLALMLIGLSGLWIARRAKIESARPQPGLALSRKPLSCSPNIPDPNSGRAACIQDSSPRLTLVDPYFIVRQRGFKHVNRYTHIQRSDHHSR